MNIGIDCWSVMKIRVRGMHDHEGHLCLDTNRIGRLTRLRPAEIRVVTESHADRRPIEAFIAEIYRRDHGATLMRHYPTLVSLHDARGEILGALGLRSAAREALFLEQYLPMPIENAVSAIAEQAVGRDRIAEVGSLASAGNGASVFLAIAAATFLDSRCFSYAVVTANAAMRRIIAAFGFSHTVLGPAYGEALADGGDSWGRYYASAPQMLAGPVAPACDLIAPYLPLELNPDLGPVLTGACGLA